jgi:hypothetical protein
MRQSENVEAVSAMSCLCASAKRDAIVLDETEEGDPFEREEVAGESVGPDRDDAALGSLSHRGCTMTQLNGRVDRLSALEAEVAQANLSLYLQLTPMEEIRWREVAAAWDRLERPLAALEIQD